MPERAKTSRGRKGKASGGPAPTQTVASRTVITRSTRVIGATAVVAVIAGAAGGAELGKKAIVLVVAVVMAGLVVAVLTREHKNLQRTFSEPLEKLTDAVRRAERGEPDPEPVVNATTELAMVGVGIRKVSAQLEDTKLVVHQREEQLAKSRTDLKTALGDLVAANQVVRERDEQLAAYAQDLQAMLRTAREVTDSPSLGFLLTTTASAALEASGLARVVIWVAEATNLAARYDSDAPDPLSPKLKPIALGEGRVGRAAAARAVVVDARRPNGAATARRPDDQGTVPGVALPLVSGSHIVGVLEVAGAEAADLETRRSQRLSVLADHAATAIEAARLETKLELLNRIDPGTGLANQRQFVGDLGVEVDRAKRYATPLSLLMVHVDHPVLEKLEQEVADEARATRVESVGGDGSGELRPGAILGRITAAFVRGTRATDSVYSLGGGDFLVLARDADDEENEGFAHRLYGTLMASLDPPVKAIGAVGEGTRDAGDTVVARTDVEPVGQLRVAVGAATMGPGADGELLISQTERALARARQAQAPQVVVIGALDELLDEDEIPAAVALAEVGDGDLPVSGADAAGAEGSDGQEKTKAKGDGAAGAQGARTPRNALLGRARPRTATSSTTRETGGNPHSEAVSSAS